MAFNTLSNTHLCVHCGIRLGLHGHAEHPAGAHKCPAGEHEPRRRAFATRNTYAAVLDAHWSARSTTFSPA